MSTSLAISPFEYTHDATANGRSKPVSVTSPCRWVLTYAGYEPAQLTQDRAALPEFNQPLKLVRISEE